MRGRVLVGVKCCTVLALLGGRICGQHGRLRSVVTGGIAGARRDARIGADAGLPEQSLAQFAACGDARHRRKRAAGAVRLSPESDGHRQRRRADIVDHVKVGAAAAWATYSTLAGYNSPASVGATVTQTLFNGFQTANRTRQAESSVLAARATLRVTEQTVLLSAATAYMNLLRDTAILDLQRRNVEVLQEQLRQTRDRFNVGEVTRTDVAQSESSLAAGRSQVLLAEANYTASRGDLPAGDRRRTGQAGAGHAGRPLLAAYPAGRGRGGHRHQSGRRHRRVQCRCWRCKR